MDFTDLCFIDSTGYHFADYPTFLLFLTTQYQAIYGADVVLDPSSQDGQWIALQALYLYQSAAVGASVYNAFSPKTAQGVGLSSVVKINGINRQNSTNSTVDLTCIGQVGTVLGTLSNPAIAIDSLQQKWILPIDTIIPSGGTVTVTAMAQSQGAIVAAANTITGIYTPTLGWQSVNNATDASIGQPIQTDAELRVRQTQSTALPSLTVFDGTIGAVENVTGVTDVQGYENDTEETDGDGLPAHSVCVVVAGGADADIAKAIQIHKTPGTTTYGNTTVNVTDSRGMPLAINFQRPTIATIGVQITLGTNSAWTDDYETLIEQSVAAYINSLGIGSQPTGQIFLSKIYIPAYLTGTPAFGSFDISQIEIKKNSGSFGSANLTINFDELPFCDPAVNVIVVIT